MTLSRVGDRTGPPDDAWLGDPADARGGDGSTLERSESRTWHRSLGWSPTSAPVAFLLLAGMALGPQGINLLSAALVSSLDPVVPVALATLGVLVGLGVGDRRPGGWRALAAACLDATVTLTVVSAGFGVVALTLTSPIVAPDWTLVLAAGICAATSLTLPTGGPLEPRSVATRVIEFGVLFPILVGGIVLGSLHTGSVADAAVLVAQASGVTLALAAAGWLLLTRATSETEERVFAVAALLLVGGVADALALSALFGGLVAGVFWRYAGGPPRDTIRRDVYFAQHPLLILVLLLAGARAEPSPLALGMAAAYLLLRLVGKVAGSRLVRRAAGTKAPDDLGLHLLPPGAFGVAFALNVAIIVGGDASVLLTVVVLGTIGSELVASFLRPARAGR